MAVRGGRQDALVPEAYPAQIDFGTLTFPDWPELNSVYPPEAEYALAKALRLRQETGKPIPYASMISSLDPARLVMVKVKSEAELIAAMPPQEDE